MATLTVWKNSVRSDVEFHPPQFLDQLLNEQGHLSDHPCGGRGICGKCKISIRGHVSGSTSAGRDSEDYLRCQAVLLGDAEVWLPEDRGLTDTKASRLAANMKPASMGAAVDIGTTTIAAKLIDLDSGNCLAECMADNPQRSAAADVMGRIHAALTGSGNMLQQQILTGLECILSDTCTQAGCRIDGIRHMTITGNTTMLYLLLGKCPRSLATAPFYADDLFGREEILLNRKAWIPPCIDAFVGGDITAAVLASGMCRSGQTTLLCDIGTNGELALWKDGTLYVTSTAAGPALEGAQITCGCRSVPGAIDKVWQEDGVIRFHTIEDLPAVGICGSGLIDAIAALLETEDIDETGAMVKDRLQIRETVSIYPKDIRNVQLAKAAIAAGIETLLEQANTNVDDIQSLYIAGNFGSHLDIGSAVRIGLIPRKLQNRVVILGNAALDGAAMMLQNKRLQAEAKRIAGCAVSVKLGGNPVFNEKFIERMLFENR